MHPCTHPRSAFTLIELLVVIAIIAILAVVVVLTLNPAEMLRQARDSNRLSDLATINSAVNLYATDQSGSSGFSLGNASSVYLSLPDASSSCSNLALATTSPSGINYACVVSTSSRNINNSGWIPVNFSLISSGSPLGSLPVDPTNQSSTGLYYTYYTNGNQFEVTSLFESQKNKTTYGQKPIVQSYPEVNAQGSSLSINPLFNPTGLVGYWPMTEGSGSSSIDQSGSGNTGGWSGTATGINSTYYSAGKVGNYAGNFDGSTDIVGVGTNNFPLGNAPVSVFAWVNPSSVTGAHTVFYYGKVGTANDAFQFALNGNSLLFQTWGSSPQWPVGLTPNTWYFIGFTYSGGTSVTMYINGIPNTVAISQLNLVNSSGAAIGWTTSGYSSYFSGSIDDVRIYNRALSAAEVQALYNAEK
jgi:prepilin-type N-terminal cleavage/methylation domain-containing protein